jgi:hypothetical protein
MSNGLRLTSEEALKRIQEKCEEKNAEFIGFDNEENEYKNDATKLILKCKTCGYIWNTTNFGKFTRTAHKCPNCAKNKKLTEEELISRVNEICKEKDFTFLGFNGGFCGFATKLRLKCNKCGEEWGSTTYNNFRKTSRNSHTCGRKNPSTMPIFLNSDRAISILNKHLENTSLEFISFDEKGFIGYSQTHVILKCKKCGKENKFLFRYVLQNDIKCKYCEKYGKFSNEHSLTKILDRCKALDYTFIGFDNNENEYKNKRTYLILKCNKCGYIWKSTTFASFMGSIIKCKRCENSWKMEKEVESYLRTHAINYIHDCRNHILPWLKYKGGLSLDFYLPDYKIGIECQGRQHFEPVQDFGGEKSFMEGIKRDKRKLSLCKEHGVKLLYYDSEHGHTEFLGEKVYNDENNLLKEITSYEQN